MSQKEKNHKASEELKDVEALINYGIQQNKGDTVLYRSLLDSTKKYLKDLGYSIYDESDESGVMTKIVWIHDTSKFT